MEGESVTRLLSRMNSGDATAFDRAFDLIYSELRKAAHRQLFGQHRNLLSTTVLVHETWLKLANADLNARDRRHFLAIAARAMRMIVIDEARRTLAEKRGGGQLQVTLGAAESEAAHNSEDLIALDAALDRLNRTDPRLARVVEWRYFGGLTDGEVAEQLGVTDRTVRRDWRKARAFLYREMVRGETLEEQE